MRNNSSKTKKTSEKKVSNPSSTGGAGQAFENRVQASRLLSMCMGTFACGTREGRIIELIFQGKISGYNTDDLICIIELNDGEKRKTLLQMKRTLSPKFNNKPFNDAISAAWYDYKNPNVFTPDVDSIFIVYDITSSEAMKCAITISEWARTSLTHDNFIEKVSGVGFSNKANRNALESIKQIIEKCSDDPVNKDDLHKFIKQLNFLAQDLDKDNTAEYSGYITSLQHVIGLTGIETHPQLVWADLIKICVSLNSIAGAISFDNLESHLGHELNRMFALYRDNISNPSSGLSFNLETKSKSDFQTSEISRQLNELRELLQVNNLQASVQNLPPARNDSINALISSQLDAIHSRIKEFKYQDALQELNRIEISLAEFDSHQQARWHLMRGTCRWLQNDSALAANDFIQSAEIYPDDEKFVAAKIRGLVLKDDALTASMVGDAAVKKFPDSFAIWQITANAWMNMGKPLVEEDIPAKFLNESDTWQMLAWDRQHHDDKAGAAAAAIRALELSPSSFFTKNTALVMCLDKAVSDPVSATFRILNNHDRKTIEQCINAFSPREQQLWQVQTPDVVKTTAANLACAYLMLGQPETALNIFREAREHGLDSSLFLRIEMESLADSGFKDKALALGKPLIETMPEEALVTYAQMAGEYDDIESVDRCIAAAKKLHPSQPTLISRLVAIRWGVKGHINAEQTISEIDAINWKLSSSIPEVVMACQVLLNAKQTSKAEKLLQVALDLLPEASNGDKYLAAQALMQVRKYGPASEVYEQIVQAGSHSQLHADLMFCYMRTGRQYKAKHLLDSFPDGWVDHNYSRHLAMELGFLAGDWDLLKTLAPVELTNFPVDIKSWLFKAMVAARQSADAVTDEIKDAPLELTGSIKDITQFANIELRHGYKARALNRIYVMRRNNLDSTDAASLHLLAHITATDELSLMECKLPVFKPGASITLRDNRGNTKVYTLDPPDLPMLPPTAEFISANSPIANALLGKSVGAVIEASGQNSFIVEQIDSAYLRLFQLSQADIDTSLIPSSTVKTFKVIDPETGDADFSCITQQLKQNSQNIVQAMDLYANAPVTIGRLASLIGRDIFDVVCGWDQNGVPLMVNDGKIQSLEKYHSWFDTSKKPYIIDAITLTELASMHCLHVLSVLPKILVTSHTRDLVKAKLATLSMPGNVGTAIEHNGQLAFIEATSDGQNKAIEFMKSINDAIDRYCQIVPAYGSEELLHAEIKLRDVLSSEEYAIILAATEYDAMLISLDARLRFLAVTQSVPSVWPQILLKYGRDKEVITRLAYSMGCMYQLSTNRSFISISSEDILSILYQGISLFKNGFPSIRRHLSSPGTELQTALRVVLNCIDQLLASCTCHLYAIIQIFEQFADALLRRSDVTKQEEFILINEMSQMLTVDKKHIQKLINNIRSNLHQKNIPELKNVGVLMCSIPPWIAYQKLQGEA